MDWDDDNGLQEICRNKAITIKDNILSQHLSNSPTFINPTIDITLGITVSGISTKMPPPSLFILTSI
uniref:Uncharacterized protein n=1 Tax=Elaeophora elaphi TaxID=1147741 RepID=A0A0R3RNK5_9BILA